MAINSIYGMDPKKARRRGKFFGTIEFELNENLSTDNHIQKNGPVGTFLIGNSQFEVTHDELKMIQSTAENAMDVINKKFKMGLLVRS